MRKALLLMGLVAFSAGAVGCTDVLPAAPTAAFESAVSGGDGQAGTETSTIGHGKTQTSTIGHGKTQSRGAVRQ
jgi:hypothetical protein